jgi:hypothetical protein
MNKKINQARRIRIAFTGNKLQLNLLSESFNQLPVEKP